MSNLQYLMITKSPEIASYIESCGVGRIFLDKETLGKEDRQANLDLPNNTHSFEDVANVRKAVNTAEVMLRINPLNEGTKEEVEKAIDAGANVIMLPFFHLREEVEAFLEIVNGRVKTNILLETASAAARAEQILAVPGIDEVHFGLNDLRISLNHDFLFEPFAGGLIEYLCNTAKKHNLSYGIGGVGRVGKEMLDASLILKEHVRLGSERVILSRVFHGGAENLDSLLSYTDFKEDINSLNKVISDAEKRSDEQEEFDRMAFCNSVSTIAQNIRQSRTQ